MNALGDSQANVLEGTRRRILEVARGLFSERTYLGVSMSDIAGRLGITKTALYYHFTNKTEIYGTVLDDVFASLRERIIEARAEATPDRLVVEALRLLGDRGRLGRRGVSRRTRLAGLEVSRPDAVEARDPHRLAPPSAVEAAGRIRAE